MKISVRHIHVMTVLILILTVMTTSALSVEPGKIAGRNLEGINNESLATFYFKLY
jgi:hypothetical protein